MTNRRAIPAPRDAFAALLDDVWQRLQGAADERAHPMRLQTVATVDADGSPDARILILRAAEPARSAVGFHTDIRSRKIAQVVACERGCTVGYDPRDGTQLRAWGRFVIRRDDDVTQKHWEQADFAVRRAYALPHVSGQPLPHPDLRMRDHLAEITAGDAEAGRPNFAVLELQIDTIEWLQVGATGDERAIMRAADDWRPQPLVP